MDSISKFYHLCELLDDDLDLVAKCIKECGKIKLPHNKILSRCEDLQLKKFCECIDNVLQDENKLCRWKQNTKGLFA